MVCTIVTQATVLPRNPKRSVGGGGNKRKKTITLLVLQVIATRLVTKFFGIKFMCLAIIGKTVCLSMYISIPYVAFELFT